MTNADWSLEGCRALVTGGSKGIGHAVARQFLELGARVVVAARQAPELDAAVAAWQARGWPAAGVCADVRRPADRARLLAAALEALGGGLDVLVNNAGTNVRKPAVAYQLEEVEFLLHTNWVSAFELSRAAHPHLRRSARASVVNVSSVAGSVGLRTGVPYGATKAALEQMTRGLAVEWGGDGIRVNAVLPWFTDTPLTSGLLADPATRAEVERRTPLGRVGQADEVASAVCFLAMPAARYVTGHCLAVDGGFLAQGW